MDKKTGKTKTILLDKHGIRPVINICELWREEKSDPE